MSLSKENKGNSKKLNNLILHIHPKRIPEKALKFTLTWGLGGMATLLIVLLAFTGILLRFVYVPTPDAAYDSILHLKNDLSLGNLVRNIHYWSATLLIIISFLHLLRVFFTGAYTKKRASNWVIGICMFLLVILMNFTGYLLPWDQLAYWAITVSTNSLKYIPIIGDSIYQGIVQGSEVGSSTLLVFYSLHTGLIPLAIIVLMLFHFWKVRKAGGVVIPIENPEEQIKKVPVWPNLLLRELVTALVLLAVIMLLSIVFDAPLKERANPLVSPNPVKAPWYFMGFQELLLHFQPILAVLVIPITIIIFIFSIPYLRNINPVKGRWFMSSNGLKTVLQALILGGIICIAFIVVDEYILRPSNLSAFLKSGIVPILVLSSVLFLLIKLQVKKYKIEKAEVVQVIFSFLLSVFITLTLVGNLFRGMGMALTM